MTTPYQFEFVTGCPGSQWSNITNRVRTILSDFYDMTDSGPDRCFRIPDEFIKHHTDYDLSTLSEADKYTHRGSYFGPCHEYGQGFDYISENYNVAEFTQECLLPFSDANKSIKQIKSHWFAYNLDWLWENFKGHHLTMVWKDPTDACAHWYNLGGWQITYPNYDWYYALGNMPQQIKKEADLVLEFADRKNIKFTVSGSQDWFNQCYSDFGISAATNSITGVKIARVKIA